MTEKTGLVDSGVPLEAWRKVSPLSPLFNAGAAVAAVFALLVWNNADTWREAVEEGWIEDLGVWTALAVLAAVLAGIALVVGVYSWLAWRRTRFAVTPEAVWFRSGIIFRSQRHALIERVQSVDVSFPFIPRIFGLGRVTVSVAGAGDLTFGYLGRERLSALRAEIMALVAGADTTEEAPDTPLYAVPTSRLAASIISKISTVLALAILIGLVVGSILASVRAESLWPLITLIPIMVAFSAGPLGGFSSMFGFRASVSPDGIRLRHGLLDTRAQTIPPRRIHAVRISQPFVWRLWGWYAVTIDCAAQGEQTASVLLPVGSRSEALLALWLVIPDLGVEDRDRFLYEALDGTGPNEYFSSNSRASRIFDPLVWRRRGLALTETCLAIRDGRITRRATFVPYARVQSLQLSAGPCQRHLELASLAVQLVPGPFLANVGNMPRETAAAALPIIEERALLSRINEPPERWLRRVEEALGDA